MHASRIWRLLRTLAIALPAISGACHNPNPPLTRTHLSVATEAATVNLLELLRQDDKAAPLPTSRLSPEWVGTIRGGEEEPLHLRLTHAGRGSNHAGTKSDAVWVARMRGNGSYIGSEWAEFRPGLPTTAELKDAADLAALQKLLGPRAMSPIDGFEYEGRFRWIEGWSVFTLAGDGKLRWLALTASLSAERADMEKPSLVRIEKLDIREGFLHSADPASAEEKELYKTADQIHQAEEAAKLAERAKLPQPLRDLVAANDAPDDSDLAIYAAALGKVRNNPTAEIFRQIAALDDYGTGHSYLADILLDGIPGAEKWAPEKRALAIRHAVAALPASHDEDKLQDITCTLLEALGGAHVVIPKPEIDLEVKLKGKGSKSMTQSRWDVNEDNLAQAAAALADWFKARDK